MKKFGFIQGKIERRLFFGLLVIHLCVLAAVYFFVSPKIFVLGSDGKDYYELGSNMIFGQGFGRVVDGQFSFADDRTPLYPVLVAGSSYFGGAQSTVFLALLQAFLAALIGVLAFRLARRVLPVFWSLTLIILFAFEPVTAGLHMLAFAETLLVFFILLSLEYLLRTLETGEISFAVAAAVALASASYTKPVAVYFGLVMVCAVLCFEKRKRWEVAGVVFLVMALLLAPWVVRNVVRTGNVAFTTFGSKAFCGYQLSAFYAARDHFPDATPEYAMGQILFNEKYRSTYEHCLIEGSVPKRTVELFVDSPSAFIKSNTIVLFAFFTNDGLGQIFETASADAMRHTAHLSGIVFLGTGWRAQVSGAFGNLVLWQQIAVVALRLFWIAVLFLALGGCVTLLRDRVYRSFAVILALSICYFSGVTILAAGLGAGARYRYAVDYQLLILAAVGVRFLVLRFSQTRAKLFVARVLSWFARTIHGGSLAVVERGGITYDLDLTEGIDLSLYLFARFQKQVTHSRRIQLPPNGIVFDVGANIGAMSLQFAQQLPLGHVYAFEPTTYGQEKMKKISPSIYH